jgi:hypothetical protein
MRILEPLIVLIIMVPGCISIVPPGDASVNHKVECPEVIIKGRSSRIVRLRDGRKDVVGYAARHTVSTKAEYRCKRDHYNIICTKGSIK